MSGMKNINRNLAEGFNWIALFCLNKGVSQGLNLG